MIRFLLIVLLALSLSGCWIYTNIEGNGSVKSIPAGSIDCKTGNTGDCSQEYDSGGAVSFVAAAEPGYSFSKWEGCLYSSIDRCKTLPWTEELAVGDQSVTVTAKFREHIPPVQAAQYTYNALGQRITKTVSGETTIFQYDLDGSLIAEIDALTGQPVRQHIHVNGEPVAQLSTDSAGAITVQYVHADHLGTPALLTDTSRQVVADIEATPFGETYIDYAEVTHNRRFPGQYKDEESGLHYNYFRDYDPGLGRYIQSDPIGLQGGLNTYAYVRSNPLVFADPYGLAYSSIGEHGASIRQSLGLSPKPETMESCMARVASGTIVTELVIVSGIRYSGGYKAAAIAVGAFGNMLLAIQTSLDLVKCVEKLKDSVGCEEDGIG